MCEHQEFTAHVAINRLEDSQDGESLACQVEVKVICLQCQTPLQFALPIGLSLIEGAYMSLDGTEARLPARIGIPRRTSGVQGFRFHPDGEAL